MKKFAFAIAVALWLSVSGHAAAQEPYEATLSFRWDAPREVEVEPTAIVINQCVAEIRQGGKVVPDAWTTFTVPDCEPLEESGVGQCGSNVTFTLNPPFGQSDVRVRCVWIADGEVLAYMELDPPTVQDEQHFWLFESISRPYLLYLPATYRNANN